MLQGYLITCSFLLSFNLLIFVEAQGQTCVQPRAPSNGFISRHDGGVEEGALVRFGCNAGFQIQGQTSATCICHTSGCGWSVAPPTCEAGEAARDEEDNNCPKTNEGSCGCGNPGTPENGCSRHIPVDVACDKIAFWCKPGYRLVGDSRMQCQWIFGWDWNNPRPRCIAERCRTPAQPRNGWYRTTNYRFSIGTILTFGCDNGYDRIGFRTSQCNNGGRWSRLPPVCRAVSCGDPGRPQNGDRTGGITFGNDASFYCHPGFTLVGPPTIRCQEDRTWSDEIPRCDRIYCGNPGAPINGAIVQFSEDPTFEYASSLEFVCDRKFTLVGSSRITCEENGQWSSPVPRCEATICAVQAGAQHLTFEASESPVDGGYLVDTRLDFSCDSGYRLSGASSVQCSATGAWSYNFPTCQIVTCSVVGAPAHGHRVGDVFTFGSVISFHCDEGYTLSGATHLACEANGRWNGTLPSCSDDGCGVPASPEHGSVQNHGVTVGSTSIFSCDQGYQLIGEATITCTPDGWDNNVPICRKIQCPNPGQVINGRREGDDFTVGGEVRFYCDENYTLIGTTNIVCTAQGRWSHPNPTCQGNECNPLVNPTHGTSTASSLTYGSWVTFNCFRGYSMSGSDRTQCLADASWSNPVPICTPCAKGYYKADITQRDCSQCPEGSTTATTASTSHLQCICQGDTAGPPGGPCTTVQCQFPVAPENGLVAECDTNLNGRCSVECSAGYVVRGTRVRTCLNNVWLPADTPPTCHVCPEDTFSEGGGRTSCELCPIHSHTQGNTGATSVNSCVCLPGYQRYYIGGPCEDVNECAFDNGGCTGEGAECHNTDGSFNCRCSIPGYALDATARNCIVDRTCADLEDRPGNGRLRCTDNTEFNSRTCNILCDDGYYFVSGNNYVTCGPTSNWTYSHQRLNRSATIPDCMEEFFIDTQFNLTTTLEVPSECDSYTNNLPADYFINTVLQERGDCSEYRCAADQTEIFMSCSNTGSGTSELTLEFTVYLENPEDESLSPDCGQTCQFEQLRSMIQATGQIWQQTQTVFTGDLGQVDTNSGASITLTGGEVQPSRPEVRCHEQGRVFTSEKLCVPCSRGYYLPKRTEPRCLPCPQGSYQDQTGQTSCTPCADDLTTLGRGAFSADMCLTQERVDIIVAGLNVGNVVVQE